jgi:hypothetical protein
MAVPVAMTTADMVSAFLIEYDRIVAQVSQSYTDEEILSFLNRSQEQIVDELYLTRRFDLLGSLYLIAHVNDIISMESNGILNGHYVLRSNNTFFPLGVRHFVGVSVYTTRSALPAGTQWSKCEWIDPGLANEYTQSLANNQILFREPKVYVEGQFLIILTDSFTSSPGVMKVSYIRYPMRLVMSAPESNETTLTSELSEMLHQSIVTKAVYLAKEATDRLQPQKQTQ